MSCNVSSGMSFRFPPRFRCIPARICSFSYTRLSQFPSRFRLFPSRSRFRWENTATETGEGFSRPFSSLLAGRFQGCLVGAMGSTSLRFTAGFRHRARDPAQAPPWRVWYYYRRTSGEIGVSALLGFWLRPEEARQNRARYPDGG
jgi:hypothetical protein